MAAWVTGSYGTPVMGRNAHVIFREFQEVFWLMHRTVSHKGSIVSLLSPLSCVQVITIHSTAVKAVAAMACSLQVLTISTKTEYEPPPAGFGLLLRPQSNHTEPLQGRKVACAE